MKWVGRIIVSSAMQVWSLLVDDGFLAIVALIAIGAVYLLSRDTLLGAVDAVGWILIGLLTTSMVVSVRRAIAAFESS
jgi:hypothetical protein